MSEPVTPRSLPSLDRESLKREGCTAPALGELFFRHADNLAAIDDCDLRRRVLRHASHECHVCFEHALDLAIAGLPPALTPEGGAK